jgi:hypothetical protein
MAWASFLVLVCVFFLGLPSLASDRCTTLVKETTLPAAPDEESERWSDWGPGYLGNLLAGLTEEIAVQVAKVCWGLRKSKKAAPAAPPPPDPLLIALQGRRTPCRLEITARVGGPISAQAFLATSWGILLHDLVVLVVEIGWGWLESKLVELDLLTPRVDPQLEVSREILGCLRSLHTLLDERLTRGPGAGASGRGCCCCCWRRWKKVPRFLYLPNNTKSSDGLLKAALNGSDWSVPPARPQPRHLRQKIQK